MIWCCFCILRRIWLLLSLFIKLWWLYHLGLGLEPSLFSLVIKLFIAIFISCVKIIWDVLIVAKSHVSLWLLLFMVSTLKFLVNLCRWLFYCSFHWWWNYCACYIWTDCSSEWDDSSSVNSLVDELSTLGVEAAWVGISMETSFYLNVVNWIKYPLLLAFKVGLPWPGNRFTSRYDLKSAVVFGIVSFKQCCKSRFLHA